MALNAHDNAIRLLGQGFSDRFVSYLEGNEKLQEALMDAAYEFVTQEIPIVKEEDVIDVASELLCNIHVAKN